MTLTPGAPQSGGANNPWLPWLLVAVLFSLLVALGTSFLHYLDGSTPLEALLKGGPAFVGAFFLFVAIAQIIALLRHRQ